MTVSNNVQVPSLEKGFYLKIFDLCEKASSLHSTGSRLALLEASSFTGQSFCIVTFSGVRNFVNIIDAVKASIYNFTLGLSLLQDEEVWRLAVAMAVSIFFYGSIFDQLLGYI